MARNERIRVFELATGRSLTLTRAGAARVRDDDAGPVTERIALVPGDRCSVIRVDLPEMSAARLNRALRWAVEDRIAGDPEGQHVVPVRRDPAGRLICVVVAHEDMDKWLAEMDQPPTRMVPDAACLPVGDDEVVAMASGGCILVSAGGTDFDRFEVDLAETMLPELIEHSGRARRLVWVGDRPPASVERLDPEIRPIDGEPLALLAAGAASSDIELLRGDYARHEHGDPRRTLRTAGWLAGVAALLLTAGALVEYVVLERERVRLERAVEARFEQLFPEIETLVRPREQARRALEALRGGSRDRFVALMAKVVPVFAGAGGVRVEALEYDGNRVGIEMTTPGLPDIDALQRQLQAAGLAVTVDEVSVQSDGARSRILIRDRAEGAGA